MKKLMFKETTYPGYRTIRDPSFTPELSIACALHFDSKTANQQAVSTQS